MICSLQLASTTVQWHAAVISVDYGKYLRQFIYWAVFSKIDYQRCLAMPNFFGYGRGYLFRIFAVKCNR